VNKLCQFALLNEKNVSTACPRELIKPRPFGGERTTTEVKYQRVNKASVMYRLRSKTDFNASADAAQGKRTRMPSYSEFFMLPMQEYFATNSCLRTESATFRAKAQGTRAAQHAPVWSW